MQSLIVESILVMCDITIGRSSIIPVGSVVINDIIECGVVTGVSVEKIKGEDLV